MAYNQNEHDDVKDFGSQMTWKTLPTDEPVDELGTVDTFGRYEEGERPRPGMWEAYKMFWQNYTNFEGRSRRSEVWWVLLVNFIISMVVMLVFFSPFFMSIVANPDLYENADSEEVFELLFMNGGGVMFIIGYIVLALYGLATFIPSLSLNCRRLHDLNMSGWWQLLLFVPCLNYLAGIGYFVVCLIDGHREANEYGPSPKYL